MLVARIVPKPGSSRIISWTMTVYDPAGQSIANFEGSWPKDRVSWDGRSSSGAIVESCADYSFVVTLNGERGAIGRASSTISTGVVILPGRTKYNISVSSITFKPDTADFLKVSEEQSRRNQETLRLLARKLGQFPGYRIRIEGHAVSMQWSNFAKATVKEREELVPLSAARAKAILSALAERGIAYGRMEAIGLGAKDQVVPDSDIKNRWKNRRVTFVLQRDPD
jgi:outer membrane protein OmpA-like peptidoglycan-associated protein